LNLKSRYFHIYPLVFSSIFNDMIGDSVDQVHNLVEDIFLLLEP